MEAEEGLRARSKGIRAEPGAARFALLIVLLHATVVALHAAAHRILNIEASPSQTLFIVIFIMAAPLLAGALIWTGARAAGAALLALSMAGALLFGLYNHFILVSPDHVLHISGDSRAWVMMFQLTAVLLALSEGMGVVAGLLTLKRGRAVL
ncbi:MAG TPA: hypothetical protein VGX92_19880 [Pyrinomonadaceae bacterium]|jgi:hypothetical protein|nr:hypothetical protein [Pyrinomonadaceae bacterium]